MRLLKPLMDTLLADVVDRSRLAMDEVEREARRREEEGEKRGEKEGRARHCKPLKPLIFS
jgi:hypothetical protein